MFPRIDNQSLNYWKYYRNKNSEYLIVSVESIGIRDHEFECQILRTSSSKIRKENSPWPQHPGHATQWGSLQLYWQWHASICFHIIHLNNDGGMLQQTSNESNRPQIELNFSLLTKYFRGIQLPSRNSSWLNVLRMCSAYHNVNQSWQMRSSNGFSDYVMWKRTFFRFLGNRGEDSVDWGDSSDHNSDHLFLWVVVLCIHLRILRCERKWFL